LKIPNFLLYLYIYSYWWTSHSVSQNGHLCQKRWDIFKKTIDSLYILGTCHNQSPSQSVPHGKKRKQYLMHEIVTRVLHFILVIITIPLLLLCGVDINTVMHGECYLRCYDEVVASFPWKISCQCYKHHKFLKKYIPLTKSVYPSGRKRSILPTKLFLWSTSSTHSLLDDEPHYYLHCWHQVTPADCSYSPHMESGDSQM